MSCSLLDRANPRDPLGSKVPASPTTIRQTACQGKPERIHTRRKSMTEKTPESDSGEQDDSAVEQDEVLGSFPDDPDTNVDLSAGDEADATRDGQSGGARGAEAGLGRHEPDMDVEEEDVANQ